MATVGYETLDLLPGLTGLSLQETDQLLRVALYALKFISGYLPEAFSNSSNHAIPIPIESFV
jgi:hypothetical protein